MPSGPEAVERFLRELDHPMADEVRRLRGVILAVDDAITEQIKWSAPSFGPAGQDRVTMRLHPKGYLQLIFHRGAKVKSSAGFAFVDESGLLEWAAPDRGVMSLRTADDVAAAVVALPTLVARWIAATSEDAPGR